MIRIAALHHLASSDEPGEEIGADTMRAALAIGDWSLAHALDVLTGADPEVRRGLAWLKRNGEAEISVSDLRRALGLLADDARALAERLESTARCGRSSPSRWARRVVVRRARATPYIPI